MSEERGRTVLEDDYGLGEHSVDFGNLGLIDEDELTKHLIATFASESYTPPRLPTVATELLAHSQDPDVDFSDLETLLERDAMLAAEVLAVSRSTFYSRRRQPDNLKDALVLIGLARLREIVLEAALTLRVFRCPTYVEPMRRLGDHSRAAAHLARLVSRSTPFGEEQAFLCGLLHDIGIAGVLLVLGDAPRGKKPPDLTMLWPAIHRAHPAAGARIAELWKLPPLLSTAISAHHHVSVGGRDDPFAALACLAEWLATENGLGMAPAGVEEGSEAELCEAALSGSVDRTPEAVVRRAAESLGIGETAWQALRDEAPGWLALNDR